MKKILLSVLVLSILLPTLASASFDTSLHYGSNGDAVTALQDFLQNQGVYAGKIDGWFGLGTLKAVQAFQSANSLKPDGYFGVGSRAKANTILATILQPSNQAQQAETGTVTPTSQPSTLDSRGCSATSVYSSTTGQSCSIPSVPTIYNLGCASTTGYSIITGQSCSLVAPTTPTITYPAGCSSTAGYSQTTGVPCNGSPIQLPTPVVTAPIPQPTLTPTQVVSTLPTSSVCSLTISGVRYTLTPCTLNQSMVHGQGDQQATITITPSSSTVSYGFSVYGNPAGFPTYGVMTDVSSGGASGATTIHVKFSDQTLLPGTYSGYLKVHIFVGSEATDSNYLSLGINLNVTASTNITAKSSTQAGCTGAVYSSTTGATCVYK